MASIRAFIGAKLDPDAMQRVVEAQRRARSIAEHAGWRATWVAPENLHVTLKFIGDLDEERVASVADAVARVVAKLAPVRLELHGVGAFPHGRPPRVLFVATRTVSGDLGSIARALDDAIAEFGVPRDTRPFRGHLTLARIKHVPRDQGLDTFAARLEPMLAGAARIDDVVLYRSELLPTGPRYHTLARSPLGT